MNSVDRRAFLALRLPGRRCGRSGLRRRLQRREQELVERRRRRGQRHAAPGAISQHDPRAAQRGPGTGHLPEVPGREQAGDQGLQRRPGGDRGDPAGELDATYIGPNPAINGYVQSEGKEIRIVAGATSGGALFVVRANRDINRPSDFANKKLATPQLGNTQDVALRAWLNTNGLGAREQGGNVSVMPAANADTMTLFQQGDVDGVVGAGAVGDETGAGGRRWGVPGREQPLAEG